MQPVNLLHNKCLHSLSKAFYKSSNTKRKLSTINEFETVYHLIEHFHKDDDVGYVSNTAFNFFNLLQRLAKPLQATEFRQHRGALDPKLIINWVMVVCNLVNMSHVHKPAFYGLIENHVDDTKHTVIDLFKDLELSDLAESYGPLAFGTDQNPAVEAELIDGFMTLSSLGKYDAP